MKLTYNEFWEILSKAYPVSHGELRLPIATHCLSIENISIGSLFLQFQEVLDIIIEQISITWSETIAYQNKQNEIIPFLWGDFTWVLRFDCMINSKGELKIIEINSDYPDGLLLHDFTYWALSWNQESTKHHDAFISLFNKSESIYIAIPYDAFFLDAYYVEYNYLRDKGYDVTIWTLRQLTREDDFIYFDWKKIDCIRRCVEVAKISSGEFQLLTWAKIRFVNTFDLRLLWFKSNLSSIKNSLVPETFSLVDWEIEKVLWDKDNWVIKPSNLFEGKNVYIGRDLSHEEWESLVMKNKNHEFVVQEFVDSKKIQVEFYDNWGIESRNVYFDLCPHFFIKDWVIVNQWLTLARFSEDKILNIAQWGWLWYLL